MIQYLAFTLVLKPVNRLILLGAILVECPQYWQIIKFCWLVLDLNFEKYNTERILLKSLQKLESSSTLCNDCSNWNVLHLILHNMLQVAMASANCVATVLSFYHEDSNVTGCSGQCNLRCNSFDHCKSIARYTVQ